MEKARLPRPVKGRVRDDPVRKDQKDHESEEKEEEHRPDHVFEIVVPGNVVEEFHPVKEELVEPGPEENRKEKENEDLETGLLPKSVCDFRTFHHREGGKVTHDDSVIRK